MWVRPVDLHSMSRQFKLIDVHHPVYFTAAKSANQENEGIRNDCMKCTIRQA